MMKSILVTLSSFLVSCVAADAAVCDYKPSKLAGQAAATASMALAGSTVATGLGMQAAGYYTLVHSGSGLITLGSTAAGASAAGTVGIVGGTGGLIGSVGAFLMAPVTLVIGGITLVGVGGYEGVCYFYVQRVTDPEKIRDILESAVDRDTALKIVPTKDGDALSLAVDGDESIYLLENLYIADGQLKHRDWFFNTNLGTIKFTTETSDE